MTSYPPTNYIPPYQHQSPYPNSHFPLNQAQGGINAPIHSQMQGMPNDTIMSQTQVFLTKLQQIDEKLEKPGFFAFRCFLYFLLFVCVALDIYTVSNTKLNKSDHLITASIVLMAIGLLTWACALGLQAFYKKDYIKAQVSFLLMLFQNVIFVLIALAYMGLFPEYQRYKVESCVVILVMFLMFCICIVVGKKIEVILRERDSVSKALKVQEKMARKNKGTYKGL